MNLIKLISSAIIVFSFPMQGYSQDLKGGEIIVRHVSGPTYEADVILYQNISTWVNRPSIVLHWGGGDTLLASAYGCGDSSTIVQIFTGTHTYLGAGNDTIWVSENFRMDGLQNISNSESESMLLKYALLVGLPGINNSSPVFLNCAHVFLGKL